MSAPTPLAQKLAAVIAASGPIGLADYMAACLGDPEHGYYMMREPFGTEGDFVTAPEISQMFGELIGLWCLAEWHSMGSPARFCVAELGPGRGTLMADLLRVAQLRPAFLAAAEIRLVELSPRLRAIQASTLGAAHPRIQWLDNVSDLPQLPLIVLANEFFDALPIRQWQRTETGWAERVVGLDEAGRLAFGLKPIGRQVATPPANHPIGGIVEFNPAASAIVTELATHIRALGGAALMIDYGHGGGVSGDTLQAVRRHRFDDPLAAPGEADLTAHVDFGVLARAAKDAGAVPGKLLTQREYLLRLGILQRAERLAADKSEEAGKAVLAARDRLIDDANMGSLFKVMAFAAPGLALLGFDSA